MIIKMQENETWIYKDNVDDMKVDLREIKDMPCESNKTITFSDFLERTLNSYDTYSKKEVLIANTYNTEWLKVLTINNNSLIITNQPVFLMNNQGQTIEKI